MYKVSVRDAAREVVIERTMMDQPTQKDFDALLQEVQQEECFIDVCRVDPDFADMVIFDQALDFECVPAEEFDGFDE